MGFPANSCGQEAPYKALRLTVYSFFMQRLPVDDGPWTHLGLLYLQRMHICESSLK